MEGVSESATRKKLRYDNFVAVHDILESIESPYHAPAHHVDPEMMYSLPVQITSMPFYTDEQLDFDTRFCKPFAAEEFERLYTERSEAGVFPAWSPFNSDQTNRKTRALHYEMPLWRSMAAKIDPEASDSLFSRCEWGNSSMRFDRAGNQTNLVEHNFWGTIMVLDTSHLDLPHIATVMYSCEPLDDRLLRGELICAATLMRHRLKYHEWNAHRFFPVFIYTIHGRQARVTQAHFDGQIFHMRQTEIVDIGSGNMAPVKMLLRWMMSEPSTNTRWEEEPNSQDEESSATRYGVPPSTPRKQAVMQQV